MRITTLAAAVALFAPFALAGEPAIVVNSFLDLPDADLFDGVPDADLDTEGLQITLRAAIMHANAAGGIETIQLAAGKYRLTRKSKESGDDVGDLDIDTDMVIVGAGATETIVDGGKAKDRVFDIDGATVTISDLTVTKGKALSGGGGGIRILDADVTLERVIVTKNKTVDPNGDGGGVEVEDGSLELTDCYIAKNRARDDAGGIDVDSSGFSATNTTFEKNAAKGEGGGFEVDSGSATFTNCTFSRNRAKTQGAAINCEEEGDVTLLNCTFVLNNAKADSAICGNDFGPNFYEITNTIFLGKGKKRPLNFGGTVTSGGGNIESGDSMDFDDDDLVNTDARPDKKLRDNGGVAPTHALRDDSPAIDFANDGACPSEDQTGNGRVDIPDVGTSTCDSGAVEYIPEAVPM